jgi:hypothetical protein
MTSGHLNCGSAANSVKRMSWTFPHKGNQFAIRVGQTAYACVYANRPWNDTGLDVVSGQTFNFSVPSGEVWIDWQRACGADGYASNRFTRPWEVFRRVPNAKWFELVATIGKSTQHPIVIGSRLLDFLPDSPGRLYLFANDLPWMYWNNRGLIGVRITRTK